MGWCDGQRRHGSFILSLKFWAFRGHQHAHPLAYLFISLYWMEDCVVFFQQASSKNLSFKDWPLWMSSEQNHLLVFISSEGSKAIVNEIGWHHPPKIFMPLQRTRLGWKWSYLHSYMHFYRYLFSPIRGPDYGGSFIFSCRVMATNLRRSIWHRAKLGCLSTLIFSPLLWFWSTPMQDLCSGFFHFTFVFCLTLVAAKLGCGGFICVNVLLAALWPF